MSIRRSGVSEALKTSASGPSIRSWRVEHVHDHGRLVAVDRELRTARRAQPDEVEASRAEGREDAARDAERDPLLAPDELVGQERQRGLEAGRPDDRVDLVAGAVDELDTLPSKRRRPGAGTIRPCWIQWSTRLFTTGRWSLRLFATGFGRP